MPGEGFKVVIRGMGTVHNAAPLYVIDGILLFSLVQFFGNFPLVLESLPANNPQAPAGEVYAQIASDLKKAIGLLPRRSVPNQCRRWRLRSSLPRKPGLLADSGRSD